MNKFMKTIRASSIAAFALAGTAVSASAAEPAMPNQPMMMQGQAQESATPGSMPGYGPRGSMGMMTGYGMQPGAGGGYGPWMMGGGMGPGYGMGPMGMMGGMMNMMGGGCPMMGMAGGAMGPGMSGYGPGMMGGGMGPGYGMGPGMMAGWAGGMGPMAALDLSDTQTAQLEKIQTESMKKQRSLMRQMWEAQEKLGDLFDAESRDPAAIGKAYGKLADVQRQALEARIEAGNKAAAVLTKEQKAQMRRGLGRGMMGY
ncbi:MAG: Spy/CpxP family protein refolding chaperone [Thiobacillus sp.]